MNYRAVIEAGGTKTTAWLVDAAGRVQAESAGGPGNARRLGVDAFAKLVVELVDRLAMRPAITRLIVCAAGLGTLEEVQAAHAALTRAGLAMPIKICNDAMAAMVGALEGEPGVLMIAGTGSIAFGAAADGSEIRCGGWGRELGDEGSGYALGRGVLHRLTWALDGRRHEPDLVYLAIQWLQVKSDGEVAAWVRQAASDPEKVASMAPFVFDLARRGDPRAQAAIAEAAEDLAVIARTVVMRLELAPRPLLVLHGGLMQRADYREKVEAAFRQNFPDAVVRLAPADVALRGGLALA